MVTLLLLQTAGNGSKHMQIGSRAISIKGGATCPLIMLSDFRQRRKMDLRIRKGKRPEKEGSSLGNIKDYLSKRQCTHSFLSISFPETVLEKFLNLMAFSSTTEMKHYYSAY